MQEWLHIFNKQQSDYYNTQGMYVQKKHNLIAFYTHCVYLAGCVHI